LPDTHCNFPAGSGLPSSRETSSISDVTDIRCAARDGDLAGSPLVWGAPPSACSPGLAPEGISGTGESEGGSLAVESVEIRRLSSERDRDRSDCEVGRGVISVVASSNVSCPEDSLSAAETAALGFAAIEDMELTPSRSELWPLVGRLSMA
jgi:hypothetical protein